MPSTARLNRNCFHASGNVCRLLSIFIISFLTPYLVGISFYEFNPLGGGFFTGRYTAPDSIPEPGSRFDQSKGAMQATHYR